MPVTSSGICQPERGAVGRLLLSCGFFLLGWVDPGAVRDAGRGGWLADEALGVGVVGGGQHEGSCRLDGTGPSVVDVGGGVQAQPAVAVVVVVPGKEVLAVRPGGFDRVEAAGEAGPVLEGLELRLGVGVVVALTG
jgi:hypothetical protein